jgi:hypothetical protein
MRKGLWQEWGLSRKTRAKKVILLKTMQFFGPKKSDSES